MKVDLLWIQEPKTKEPSTSLTLVVLSALILIVAIGLEMSGLVKNTSMCFEFFGASCGLHFGNRFISSKGNTIEGNK